MKLVDINLVTKLVAEKFPQFSKLPIRPVEPGGHDNLTFRLGDEMLIRLPTKEDYALAVIVEQVWLPKLAPHLSLTIPKPLFYSSASDNYPWNWSIYNWIEGKSANTLEANEVEPETMAKGLASFLKELHQIDTRKGGPRPSPHNFWRGDYIGVYDMRARKQIAELEDVIDSEAALSLWNQATSSKWSQNPVWVHGDFASGNILVKDGKLTAVIDFGCMGIGDPACDLVIAWTFLNRKARKIFKKHIALDANTWLRARGWALWKATFELCNLTNKNGSEARKHKRVIEEVLREPK